MGEIINLNRARKAKARTEREAQAAANRRAFGRTRAEREADAAERRRQAAELDARRLEPDE
ncbi:DUF4169 family protein [Phaeospirillum tilakii]|uniref:DUF4169 family protein n=1 Tax=Phaeospirillum tilakii TaxID=741673 RepID=A0ABW5C9X0_9PROT